MKYLVIFMLFNLSSITFANDNFMKNVEREVKSNNYDQTWGICMGMYCNNKDYYNTYRSKKSELPSYSFIYSNKNLVLINIKEKEKKNCYSFETKEFVNMQTCKTKMKNIDNDFKLGLEKSKLTSLPYNE